MNPDYKKVLKAIEKYDTIVVLRHEVPDFDASGSQFAMVNWIKENYPNKKVYALGKPHKIFAPKLYPLTDSDVDLSNCKYLCLIVDVANRPRIDGKEYIDGASYVIKIDHHPLCDDFGDVSIIDEHAAAAAELIGDMLISFKKPISQTVAFYLYSALVGDSGCFQYSDTNPRTLQVAAKCLETGFNFTEMFNKMFLKNIGDLEILKYLYSIYKISDKGVAYYIVNNADLVKFNIPREKIKAFVNLFSGYEEIKIWVQFSEDIEATDEYKWRVSIRSRGVKINDVASLHNGGGHDNASGAKCVDEAEMLTLIEQLGDLL